MDGWEEMVTEGEWRPPCRPSARLAVWLPAWLAADLGSRVILSLSVEIACDVTLATCGRGAHTAKDL